MRRAQLDAPPGPPLDLLALHRRAPARYPFVLQSAAAHALAARYDVAFAFPGAALWSRGGRLGARGITARGDDFFAALSAWAAAEHEPQVPDDVPFAGGWFLLLGYEAAGLIEPRLRLPPSPFSLPDALAVRCTAAVVQDRTDGALHLLAEDPALLDSLREDVAAASRAAAPPAGEAVREVREEAPEKFITGVERIQRYLRDGDVFQVNLSRAWAARLPAGVDAAALYARLRRSNPAPFAGLAAWEGAAVLSSSPERLVQVRGRDVQTRPIAGTRPRGADAGADSALRAQLTASAKERAEHVMLIDLERNDLGRVCEPGSVTVSELMTVESYAHVHHIVSNLRGRLRSGVGPGEVLRAVFPGGTITGCPKVRAMEIIAELEGEGRGPYTGAMGYLGRDGRLDMNILIRSLVCDAGSVHLRAGAGIVADSKADAELAETRAKARGLLGALGAGA
ncbi:MAG TPA: aminodeoxychorismate synthase component I [Candidatus Binatia bacterium]|nr:aminodeoxychorismate synthase component I [Candidatus Binatia bacterium]